MATRILVPVADHRSQRRRLTRTRATNNNAQSKLVHNNVFEDRRQVEALERRDFRRNHSKHGADVALLNECTYAKATDALRRNCEITLFGRVKFLDLFVVHDRTHHDRRMIRC